MNIGEVAKLTGLTAKSIRLYEEKGLILPPSRSESGYRDYSDKHIQQLILVARAKTAGFSLVECKEFVQLAENPNRTSKQVRAHAEEKLKEVETKIQQLEAIRSQLQAWVMSCPGDEGSECPIMDDLTHR
ncbi:Cu(I)-responsive transcriptional regulator [Vibrio agarivorans]|uniref:Cu(I)-responsive transcriptional regulator n=1 Tax=Vibrio agarivorans TaxID=153622 RepID=UPI00222F1BC5|nr:Cu(I)-responsive transcriptional regulator [Vibrio agarivorans]MDN3659972.1 Cu(I)-responsive transcriptional regulator [Vibrio agarivorans]